VNSAGGTCFIRLDRLRALPSSFDRLRHINGDCPSSRPSCGWQAATPSDLPGTGFQQPSPDA
jgi:hypothetical protein